MEAAGLSVAVVTFELNRFATSYVEETRMAWPLLIDSDRRLYQAYGMERVGWKTLLSPSALSTYLGLALRGRRLHRATGDVHQMGGDVLIDPKGVVRFHYVSSDPADRPGVAALLKVIR